MKKPLNLHFFVFFEEMYLLRERQIRQNSLRSAQNFQSSQIDPSLVAKLAKIIDSKNPEQTVELLTNPMSKLKQRDDRKTEEAKKNLDLR